MIVHPVDVTSRNGVARVAAQVESESGARAPVQELWYEFPSRYADAFSGRMDAFATAVLLAAMANGEDLHVRGALSPKLLRGMLSYQNVFHAWYPERFRPADIRIEETAAAADRGAAAQRDVAAAFSAGVDSSYTLLRHLDECAADPGHRVTHAIFVHGFDIPLEDAATFEDAARAYLNALGPLGVELIPMRTNAREVGERAAAAASVSWDDLHGAALASVPMMLDRRIRRFYLPASFAYTDLRPWGSHPVCDPFLSTDTMEVDHDGAEERNVKIAALADWAPAQGWLRVCWKKPSATENCCVCYKCVLTMFCLELVGALAAFRTFPKPLSRPAIRALSLPVTEWAYAERLVWLARAAGKNDIAGELAVALARSRRGRQDSRFRRPWRRKG